MLALRIAKTPALKMGLATSAAKLGGGDWGQHGHNGDLPKDSEKDTSIFRFMLFESWSGSSRMDYMSHARKVGDHEAKYPAWVMADNYNYENGQQHAHGKFAWGKNKMFNVFTFGALWVLITFNPHWKPTNLMNGNDWRTHNHNGW